MSKTFTINLTVFGEPTRKVKVGPQDTIAQALRRLDMLPDDYIMTLDGKPVPCDSSVERKDYVLYKVASGG